MRRALILLFLLGACAGNDEDTCVGNDCRCIDEDVCAIDCGDSCDAMCDRVDDCTIDCGEDCEALCLDTGTCDVALVTGAVTCEASECAITCLTGGVVDCGNNRFACDPSWC